MENGTSYVSPSAPGGTPGALPGIGIPPSAPGGGAPGVTPFQEALMSRMTRPFGLAVSQKLFVTITHISASLFTSLYCIKNFFFRHMAVFSNQSWLDFNCS